MPESVDPHQYVRPYDGHQVFDELMFWTREGWAYNATTDVVTLTGVGQSDLGAFVNPAGSNRDVYLMLGEFHTSANAIFRRLRAATIELKPGATPATVFNRNQINNPSPVQIYPGSAYTRTGGIPSKTAHIAAFGEYVSQIRRVRVVPGQVICWTMQPTGGLGGAYTASIYLEWFERPIET